MSPSRVLMIARESMELEIGACAEMLVERMLLHTVEDDSLSCAPAMNPV